VPVAVFATRQLGVSRPVTPPRKSHHLEGSGPCPPERQFQIRDCASGLPLSIGKARGGRPLGPLAPSKQAGRKDQPTPVRAKRGADVTSSEVGTRWTSSC
jgi:hypothetical protein